MRLVNRTVLENQKQNPKATHKAHLKRKPGTKASWQIFGEPIAILLFWISIGAIFAETEFGPFGAWFAWVDPMQPQLYRKLMHQLTWNVIGFVPVFVLLFGFANWRSICPLAFISQQAGKLRRGQKAIPVPATLKQIGQWAPILGLGTVVYLRLLGMNSLPMALGAWLLGMAGAAALCGAIWGGRTWCHYFCPMGVVEHLFEKASGREGKQDNPSMCSPCIQCKLNCPDISIEKSTQPLTMRSFFFCYPGLVVSFFGWPYLHSGSIAGWLESSWYFETVHLDAPGFFFWASCPTFLAIAISLSSAGLMSYSLFSMIEKIAPSTQKRSAHKWTQRVAVRTGASLFTVGAVAPLGNLLLSAFGQ